MNKFYENLETAEGQKRIHMIAKSRDKSSKDLTHQTDQGQKWKSFIKDESIITIWKVYFEELLNEENPGTIIRDGNPHGRIVQDISRDEVKKALDKMKKGKAVEPDGILVEVWKCLGEEGIDILLDLMTKIYHQERMPDMWSSNGPNLQKGSALSPYVFDIVMDVITSEVKEEVPWCANQQNKDRIYMDRWREMAANNEIGSRRIKRVSSFKYLGSVMSENGNLDAEVSNRIQCAWILCDRRISAKVKGKFYKSVVRPGMLYGAET
ncbi:uncharacterized protein LOC135226289 [Macrobrachium nipponense]|uniref:uncharacterized protein LOC135226289 n=1 Tax=Macrobrachium nipponense TaxID=159736 RepID=UPI0030C876A9